MPVLLLLHGARAQDQLAYDLFAEAAWPACRTECARLLGTQPDHATAPLMKAVAGLRMGLDASPELLAVTASTNASAEARAMAHYELGRWHAAAGRAPPAALHWRAAFGSATSEDLFLRAGCSLALLLDRFPDAAGDTPALRNSLRSCASLWTPAIKAACALEAPADSGPATTQPAQWLIAFYRRQIGPAIGQRCCLHPSCSEYATRALRRHGLLGLALYADRAAREPDIVLQGPPVLVDNTPKRADPLEDHDWWWRQTAADREQAAAGRALRRETRNIP